MNTVFIIVQNIPKLLIGKSEFFGVFFKYPCIINMIACIYNFYCYSCLYHFLI